MSKSTPVSAGLLMFRKREDGLEFLLVHPGGPYWTSKDDGAWTIPKGEAAPDEDLLTRAQIEFEEELGLPPVGVGDGEWIALGSVKQQSGKTVHAWAFEGDLPEHFEPRSNIFEIEWPPRSGKKAAFPEIDRAAFFGESVARQKIIAAQEELIDRLLALITKTGDGADS